MNREEIKSFIPHREPMLLIDSVYVDEQGQACGSYTVQGDEFFLQGHFPGNPVVPGVILCEMMAQTCSILLAERCKGQTPYLTSISNIKFRNVVKPRDTIMFECKIEKEKQVFFFAKGKGMVNGKVCVEGEFSFAVLPPKKDS